MKIDRSVFLALATSIAAVACTAAGEDTQAGGDALSLKDGGADAATIACWHPTTDLASGASRDAAVKKLGFDPIANYPAAESFCSDFSDAQIDGSPSMTEKCYEYAKNYQPHAAFAAYEYLAFSLTEGKDGGAPVDAGFDVSARSGWDVLYGLDNVLATDASVCTTDKGKAACQGSTEQNCATFASQLNYAAQAKLTACLKQFDVYTCAESFL